jgi:DNA-binding GntR family transcriptional regulator
MTALTSHAVYEQLLKKLTSGDYPPGMRLVNRTLAEEMEVSVMPIREALTRLTSEGLVEHIPGAGAFVREFSGKDIIKLYAFREQLEVFAVHEAADNIQSYQQRRLEKMCDEAAAMWTAIEASDPETPDRTLLRDWLHHDGEFHETIIEAADNDWLARAASSVRMLSHVNRSKPRDLIPRGGERTLEEHRAIAEAIGNGDGDEGAEIMRQHILHAMDTQLRYMEGERG